MYLDEHQFALKSSGLRKVGDLVHRNELVKLLGDLLIGDLVGLHDDRDARHRGVFGRTDRKALDIESATRDKSRNTAQYTRFVLYEH